MPRRELKHPAQVEQWLVSWGQKLTKPGGMILIGSGGLLWHAAQKGIETPLPENSMDVDPITQDDEVAALGYEAHIGSSFEQENGWHVKLMPPRALEGLPFDWKNRAATKSYDLLTVIVPSVEDILVPKLKRGETRDISHSRWAKSVGLC
jgi:hypothetical protein